MFLACCIPYTYYNALGTFMNILMVILFVEQAHTLMFMLSDGVCKCDQRERSKIQNAVTNQSLGSTPNHWMLPVPVRFVHMNVGVSCFTCLKSDCYVFGYKTRKNKKKHSKNVLQTFFYCPRDAARYGVSDMCTIRARAILSQNKVKILCIHDAGRHFPQLSG